MKLPKDQPFWTSVILHVVVLLGLFLATIVQAFKPKEKPHVFEMVDAPTDSTDTKSAPPLLTPVESRPVELPPVPNVKIPPAQATRDRAPSPREKPTKPKMVSYEEFIKDNPIKNPKQSRQTVRPQIAVPQIDVPQLVVPENPATNTAERSLTRQQLSELQKYSVRLRSRIDVAWAKPAQLAGVRLVAEVVFDVSASGRITNVRLRPQSGNGAFDQSVLAAFRKVGSVGATPTGRAHTFSLPFRMLD